MSTLFDKGLRGKETRELKVTTDMYRFAYRHDVVLEGAALATN